MSSALTTTICHIANPAEAGRADVRRDAMVKREQGRPTTGGFLM